MGLPKQSFTSMFYVSVGKREKAEWSGSRCCLEGPCSLTHAWSCCSLGVYMHEAARGLCLDHSTEMLCFGGGRAIFSLEGLTEPEHELSFFPWFANKKAGIALR